ncbi:MAG: PorP/SprF family type IX secretion system membrane protein [Bacteroides sp.]|nr:PorP/SprF family type IX secretion system membrane protein [Ruminococcus flavefaciens]MCM1555722.1 PorP/SprF family type IX secretion system membrane protein [Bacteroides sp.]
MKRIFKYSFVLAVLSVVMSAEKAHAQSDAQFSQFYANRLFYNPAGIADDNLLHVSLTDREQYLGTSYHPGYRLLNGSYFFDDQNMGVGLTVHQWNQNIENDLVIKASYMYRLQVGYDAYVNFGLSVGMIHRFLQEGYLPGGDRFVPTDDDKFNPNLDMGLGVEFHTSHILAGVAVQHLPIKLGDNPARAALHSYYYFGYNFFLDEEWSLFPMLALRMGDRRTNIDLNVSATYRDIVNFGVSYRLDALALMAGVNINKNFSLSYSCDINIGVTSKRYKPSHELVLTYRCEFRNPDRPLVKFE